MSNVTGKSPKLPRAVYYQCVWIIRDMKRLRMLEAISEYENAADEVAFCDEDWCTMVTDAAIEEARRKLKAVRDAIDAVPEEMRQGLLDYYISGDELGDFAHENTWKKWKRYFIYNLARNLNLI